MPRGVIAIWSKGEDRPLGVAEAYVTRELPALRPVEVIETSDENCMVRVSEVLGDKKDTCRHIVMATLAEMGHPVEVCIHRLDTLASMGVTVHSVAENINTYRQPFLEKIWRGLRGVPNAECAFRDTGAGRPPFGYKKVGRQLYDIPEEHVIIAEMIQAFRQGEAVDSIARRMNAKDHRTRCGGKWYPKQVERIVKAPENLRYWSDEPQA